MITRIEFTGLKHRDGHHELAATTAIVGPNRSGKTSVRDALFLACLGHHPETGKTNQAIMKLAGAPALIVAAHFDSGEMISRAWKRAESGRISRTETGTLPNDFDLCAFAPSVFLGMKATERTAYLSSLGNGNSIMEKLEAFADSCDDFPTFHDYLEDESEPPAILDKIQAEIVEFRKEAKRENDRLKKAVQEHLSSEPPVADGSIPADLPSAERAAEKAGAAKQKRDAARAIQIDLDAKYGAMKAIIEKAERSPAPEPDPERLAHLRGVQVASEATKATFEQFSNEVACLENDGLPAEILEEAAAHVAEWGTDNEATRPTQESVEGAARELERLEEKRRALEVEANQRQKQLAEHKAETAATLENDLCPTCGSAGHEWKENYLTKRNAEAAGITECRETAKRDLEKVQDRLKEVRECQEETAAILEKFEAVEKSRELLQAENQRRLKLDRAKKALEALPPRITREESDEFQSLLKAENRGEIPTAAELETAARALEQAAADVEAFELEAEAAAEVAARAKEAAEIMQARKEWEAVSAGFETRQTEAGKSLERAETLVSRLKTLRAEITRETWEPITETVTVILQTVFNSPQLAAIAATETDFGITDENGYRDFEACSGAEQTVIAAAIGVALAENTGSPVVIVDELSRLDTKTREAFQLCAGERFGEKVEQVICLDHNPTGYQEFESIIDLD